MQWAPVLMIQNTSNQLSLFGSDSDSNPVAGYGWMGSSAQFLAISLSDWLDQLSRRYHDLYNQRPTATQIQAWQDCGELLQQQLTLLRPLRPDSSAWTLIFEYELPHEGGRRPDLVLLATGQILVLEFKQKTHPSQADLDQVAAYARDLAEYHRASHHRPVIPILVPTRQTGKSQRYEGVQVLAASELAVWLSQLEQASDLDPTTWVQSDYAPLPSVMQAARRIFQQEPLPEIKRARSAGIPELLEYLYRLVEQAQANHERHLVLITGVPGAGKTLVGLQFVYQHPVQHDQQRPAVFLSGNGPLITVLQYALKSKAFVQPVRNFYLHHEVRRQTAPTEHLIVFDEAQRAWDAERMAEKYGIDRAAAGAVLRIAERVPDWCVVVGLIGEGQEIHVGEEEGLEQWNQGLSQASAIWQVHCAPGQTEFFTAVPPDRLHPHGRFNLTTSLRSHLASHVQTWVAHLLAGELGQAVILMPKLRQAGFAAYLTHDLALAKAYCRERYRHQPQKRYGLLASSRARNLAAYGIPNDYYATSRLNMGAWYIDPPDSPLSCCALERAVTEFGCQGLELDFPIIGWGDDLRWDETAWSSSVRQKNVRNPLRLRINSYRVLLTRGRDGLIVFVPPEAKMKNTYETLHAAGLEVLSTHA
ncbi:MAG: DUF2075 domain-containing protein [Elainella sp. C42_A2020_010]|nr:DUF2075 domain-containing protein [Elainella sp. C42_A2020_010]